jgi:hypothetical protein
MGNDRNKNRVTVTLEEGHRAQLEHIAHKNRVKLAYVVRKAVAEFLANPHRGEPILDFSTDSDKLKTATKDGK